MTLAGRGQGLPGIKNRRNRIVFIIEHSALMV